MSILCLLLLASVSADIPDIERGAVETRRAIGSGEVVVRSKYSDGRGRDWHIWWDGPSFRQDRLLPDGLRDTDVWANGRFLHWTNELGATGLRSVAKLAMAQDRDVVGSHQPIDPRRIGMIPQDFVDLMNRHVDEYLANPARQSTATEEVEYNGVPCTLVTITRSNGAVVEAWISKERGHNPLKLVIRSPSGQLIDEVETDVALYEPTGVWFPKTFRYKRSVSGGLKAREIEEEGTVEVISLNQPIPPEVFTFAGIGVPVGWPVSDHTRPDISGSLAWDGKNVVTVERAADTARAASRVNMMYLAGAVLLALVGAVLLWRFMSLRSARG